MNASSAFSKGFIGAAGAFTFAVVLGLLWALFAPPATGPQVQALSFRSGGCGA